MMIVVIYTIKKTYIKLIMNINVRIAYALVPDRMLGWMYGRNVYNGTITRLSRVASALDVTPR